MDTDIFMLHFYVYGDQNHVFFFYPEFASKQMFSECKICVTKRTDRGKIRFSGLRKKEQHSKRTKRRGHMSPKVRLMIRNPNHDRRFEGTIQK